MLDLLELRWRHGYQAVPNIQKAALPPNYRGFPLLDASACVSGCAACVQACPTAAIGVNSLQLDLGKCVFCGDCQRVCETGAIRFSPRHLVGATERETLIISSGMTSEAYEQAAIQARKEVKRLFGHSLKLRQVSAAGCNGCEMELSACGNVNFDMGRFGIDFVASPRHADGVVITGPISKNMAPALKDALLSIGEPRLVIAVGACAIDGGVFAGSPELDRRFFQDFPVDLYVPGCPPHPLTFIRAMLRFLGRE